MRTRTKPAPSYVEQLEANAIRPELVRLDVAARSITVSISFRELVAGCNPRTGYTPTLRLDVHRAGSFGERLTLRLRRALHAAGVEISPAFGSLAGELGRYRIIDRARGPLTDDSGALTERGERGGQW